MESIREGLPYWLLLLLHTVFPLHALPSDRWTHIRLLCDFHVPTRSHWWLSRPPAFSTDRCALMIAGSDADHVPSVSVLNNTGAVLSVHFSLEICLYAEISSIPNSSCLLVAHARILLINTKRCFLAWEASENMSKHRATTVVLRSRKSPKHHTHRALRWCWSRWFGLSFCVVLRMCSIPRQCEDLSTLSPRGVEVLARF